MSYQLTIITPSGKVFDNRVDSMTAPAVSGSLGILPNHAPFSTLIGKGVLGIEGPFEEKWFAVNGGILEVGKDHNVLVLCNNSESRRTEEDALALAKSYESIAI